MNKFDRDAYWFNLGRLAQQMGISQPPNTPALQAYVRAQKRGIARAVRQANRVKK